MVEPISDHGSDEDTPDCEHCGEPVAGPDHRVITRVEDGQAVTVHFCEETCLQRWRVENE